MTETLQQRVHARGARPWTEVHRVVVGVSRAIGQAHLRKRGHGGICPDAIACIPGEGARALRVVVPSPRSGAGGALAWEALENVLATRPPSPASDVWTLGLLTYYLLSGRPFWRAVDARTCAVNDLVCLVTEMKSPPRASERASEQRATVALWPGFDAWLARCLASDPAARFPSAPKAVSELARSRPRLART